MALADMTLLGEMFSAENLFTLDSLFTLGMLVLLQAVLGFDNLLYISIESGRAPLESQAKVRRIGIGLAIILRIVLLLVLIGLLELLKEPLFALSWTDVITGTFDFHSLTLLAGGVFILYTAVKEISHMLTIEHLDQPQERKTKTVGQVIAWIVLMNLVFSFDSILSAMALTGSFWIMAVAIVISGCLMIWLADHVATFLKKNRMYEVLGLFILLIVGIMLLSEGGHKAHLHLVGHPVEQMTKTTFYFSIAVLVLVDIVQGRYQKKLLAQKKAELEGQHA